MQIISHHLPRTKLMFKTVFAIIVKIKLKLNHKSKTVPDSDTIHNKYKNKSSNIVAQTLY